jgi:hypothetical protein
MGFPYSLLLPLAWHQRRHVAAVETPAGEPGREQRFEQALQLLAQGRTAGAYRQLAALANSGHAPASRIALTLARRGTALFGGQYPASASERQRWERSGL